MGMELVQGRTNNHISWVMVSSSDHVSPVSNLSAATKIKIYGTLEGQAAVNFVSSGTGSLTNDIVHVGASANGVYHIALVKADLSDASAAWYDAYTVILSATGADYTVLELEGVRTDTSYLSAAISDVLSAVTQINSRVLIAQSAASDAASAAQQANSRVLVAQSQASDVYSLLVIANSNASDAMSAAQQANSRALVNQSAISDIYSLLTADTTTLNQVNSRALVNQSAVSDIYSLLIVTNSAASDAASAAQQGNSRALVNQSVVSDIYSLLTVTNSRVLVAQSAASDAQSAAAAANTAVAVTQSMASDIYSLLQAGVTVTAANARLIADSVLNRNLATGGSGNTRNVQNALRGMRNKTAVSGGVARVYQEDDATTAWSGAVSTAAGNPVVSVDPS